MTRTKHNNIDLSQMILFPCDVNPVIDRLNRVAEANSESPLLCFALLCFALQLLPLSLSLGVGPFLSRSVRDNNRHLSGTTTELKMDPPAASSSSSSSSSSPEKGTVKEEVTVKEEAPESPIAGGSNDQDQKEQNQMEVR
jgi:hypothetical protein